MIAWLLECLFLEEYCSYKVKGMYRREIFFYPHVKPVSVSKTSVLENMLEYQSSSNSKVALPLFKVLTSDTEV